MRRFLLVSLLALACARHAGAACTDRDSVCYVVQVSRANRVNLSVTNYGFFGNNFNSRSPSFEFPSGSGYEHMSRAGLWVGGVAQPDTGTQSFTAVSAAIVDNTQGSDAASETEFTPAGKTIGMRSRIENSPVFSPDAISDEDLLTSYSDEPARRPSGNQSERHLPLDLLVHQRMLGFSLEAADAFEVVQFTIVNRGNTLQNVYVGLYAQLVSGDRKAYSGWPPSSNGGPGSWYYKSHIEYDDARRLYLERYCEHAPYPGGCNIAYCPPWAGIELLGVTPGSVADKTVSYNGWSFSTTDTTRDEDRERYALMSNGARHDPSTCVPGTDCSPIMLLTVGPFTTLDPGDSVRVDFAFVGGENDSLLRVHADFAQFAHDIDYKLPSPPPSPRVHIETGERRVDFYWDDSPESVEDPTSPAPGHRDFEGYRLYLGTDRQHPSRIAQFDLPDTTGFNTGFDEIRLERPKRVDGRGYPYHYAVTGLRDGFSYYGAVTSYDIGDAQFPSFESSILQNKFQAVPGPAPGERAGGVVVFPNPYRVEARWDQGTLVRDHYLWFSNLPARCRLKVFTLAGDLVFEQSFDGSRYRGEGARGLYDPRQDFDTTPPALSGTSYAWNMITRDGQAAATGLYLFSVEDLERNQVTRGKFLVVKSDREN